MLSMPCPMPSSRVNSGQWHSRGNSALE
jgi:hypothetical protein